MYGRVQFYIDGVWLERFSDKTSKLFSLSKFLWPFVLAVATLLSLVEYVVAQELRPLIIGVSADMSGPYVDSTGPGQVVAAELAVEDFGGQILGRRIIIKASDDQNKPDIASANARRWFDVEHVEAIVGGGNSSAALAVLNVARAANRVLLVAGAGNPDFTGKECSPISIQWAYDTYAQATATGAYLSRNAEADSWFLITADYAFGHALERDTTRVVKAAGGRIMGSVRAPLGTADYSSFLLQAQNSGANVLGLALAGQDVNTAIKQAGEFGLTRTNGGLRIAGLSLFSSDIPGLGMQAAQGLISSESFYWDRTDETRAWTKRYWAKRPGKLPNMLQVGVYSALTHYLKAVQAAGTTEARTVIAKMKELPVNDFNNSDLRIRPDGRVLNPMYVLRVKAPSASMGPMDVQEVLATLPPEQVFRSAEQSGCLLAN